MSSLESQAAERKARLAALRNKTNPQTGTTASISTTTTASSSASATSSNALPTELPPVKSRNFDQELRAPISGLLQPPTAVDENSETVEALSQAIQDQVLAQFRARADVNGVQESTKSKKITWDLERDLKDDLDLLNEKTDEAIKALVKDRLRRLQAESVNEEEQN